MKLYLKRIILFLLKYVMLIIFISALPFVLAGYYIGQLILILEKYFKVVESRGNWYANNKR